MIYTQKTKLDCKEIEKVIEDDAKNVGLMFKKHFPFSENLPGINEYASVYELCKGSVAVRLLNTQPELNVLMPCRIALYKKDNICYASTPDLSVLLNMLECDKELKKEILDLYNDIISIIKNW